MLFVDLSDDGTNVSFFMFVADTTDSAFAISIRHVQRAEGVARVAQNQNQCARNNSADDVS